MSDQSQQSGELNQTVSDEHYFHENFSHLRKSDGSISIQVLDWSDPAVTEVEGPFDIIVGADIVASLYDPIALVDTMYEMSSPFTILFISGKTRLDLPHQIFESELRTRYQTVERVCPKSRNQNPDVFLLIVKGKK
jgi:hypothetical protein